MDIQLLLSIQRECNRKGIKIPWDAVATMFGPNCTGGAVIQHLSKLRQKRVRENLPVPESLTRGGGGGTARGKYQKTTPGNAKAAQKNVASNEEDDDEDFDVDKASDSEASFGEERNKREVKSRLIKADSEVSENDDDEYRNGAARKAGNVKKTTKRNSKKCTSVGKKAKGIKAESSASPSIAAIERAPGRKTRSKITQYTGDEDDTVTDSAADEPRLAAGSSFLKLIGLNDNIKDEINGSDVGIQNSEDNRKGQEMSDTESPRVTVLKLGKSEQSLAFLRQLGSSQIVEHSNSGINSHSPFAGISRSQSTSLGVDVNMVGNDFNPQYYGQEAGYANFGSRTDGSFGGVGNSSGFPPFPYSASMHSLMPLTPMSGVPSGAFPSGPFESDIGMNNGVAYSAGYTSRATVPAFSSPYTPGSGGAFSGFLDTTFGEYGNNGQTSYDSPSRNAVDMGDVNFNGIGTTGVGLFQPVSIAGEYSSADLAGKPTTSGHAFDWTAQNHSVMSSMPIDDDMSQFMNSTFNDDMGEPEDLGDNILDNIFSDLESGSGGSVNAHGQV